MKRSFLLSLGLSFILASLSIHAQEKESSQAQLKKIQSSIALTKEKIRSTKEVSFVPDLQFVLAELLLQKARLMVIVKKEASPKNSDLDFSAEKRQVLEGVEQLKLIEEKYPSFKEMDKVLLTMGLELRKVGDQEKALQVFKRLSERNPQGPYASRAFLEVGNIFFDKKDYEFALEQYKKVLELPQNPSTVTASFKAGWSEVNLEHFSSALLFFEKTYLNPEAQMSSGDNEGKKADFREDALLASVLPYSELSEKDIRENPRFSQAIGYYESVAGDKILFRRVLRRLAQRLDFKKRFREASDATETAFLIQADLEESLENMEVLFTQRRKAKRTDLSAAVLDKVAENLWLLNERKRERDLAKYEPFVRELLTKAHAFALSIKRVEDLRALVDGYETYLKIYPQAKTFAAILTNQAEAAFLAKDYVRAAHLYIKLANRAAGKNLPKQKEFFDSAAQSFAAVLTAPEDYSLLDKSQSRVGYANLTKAYAKFFPQDPNLPALRFNVGKNFYDEQSYAESSAALRDFLRVYPHSPQAAHAAVLMMDCFYLQDDMKGLLREGRKLLQSNLDARVKTKLAQVLQEAQLKQVQSVAGDFATRKYADKFLEVAKKSKNSAVGETALFEAFNSLRAGADDKFYEVGEQYLAQFGTNVRAKDILNQMIKMSLVTVELGRAGQYMQIYASKYPGDAQAGHYLQQSVLLLELTGQADEAIEANLHANNSSRAVFLAAKFGRWPKVQQISAGLSGGVGLYYQGLSFWRQGKKVEGLGLLQRSFSDRSGQAPKDLQAHAGIILAESQIEELAALERESFSIPILQKILEVSKNTNQTLQEVLQKESGRWSVASLAVMGRLNSEIAGFLAKASPPPGLPVPAFRKLIDPRVAEYLQAAKIANTRCLDLSQKEAIPSEYIRMCRGRGTVVTELSEMKISPVGGHPAVAMSSEIRLKLLKAPKAMDVLAQALQLNESQNNFYGAYAISSRMTEIDPQSAQSWSDLGRAALKVAARDEAIEAFRRSLKLNTSQVEARRGLAQIFGETNLTRQPAQSQGKGQ